MALVDIIVFLKKELKVMSNLMNGVSNRFCLVGCSLVLAGSVIHGKAQGIESVVSETITEGASIEEDNQPLDLEPKVKQRKSRIGLGFSFFSGTKSSVTSNESFSSAVGPATGGSINRQYADGYVFQDSSDNLGDLRLPSRTHFFGFDNSSQVNNVPLAGTIDFHEARFNGGAYSDPANDDFSPGVELLYNRLLKSRERFEYELEMGLGFHQFDYESRNRPGDFEVLTDTYELGGINPLAKGAPYQGSFLPHISGSPKIGDLPNRRFNSVTGQVNGVTEIDSVALLGRIGPNVRYYINDSLQISALGGLLIGYMSAEVTYDESQQYSIADTNYTQQRQGRFKGNDIVFGLFGALRLSHDINDRVSVFGEGRYMHMQSMNTQDAMRVVEMDLAGGIGLVLGLDYRF